MTVEMEYKMKNREGNISFECNQDDDDNLIIEKAKKLLTKEFGLLPEGVRKFEITNKIA